MADKEGAKPERRRRKEKLTLWPLSLEEAVEAVVRVEPPPKEEKAPPKERRPRKRTIPPKR